MVYKRAVHGDWGFGGGFESGPKCIKMAARGGNGSHRSNQSAAASHVSKSQNASMSRYVYDLQLISKILCLYANSELDFLVM